MQKITPCLWFDGKAEEAMNFYTAIFKDSRVTSVMRHGDAGPGPKGSVLATTFHLEGQEFCRSAVGGWLRAVENVKKSIAVHKLSVVHGCQRVLTLLKIHGYDNGRKSQSWVRRTWHAA